MSTKKTLLFISIFFLSAFILLSPQISWAISCKCTAPTSMGPAQINCRTFPTEYTGSNINNCDQHKAAIAAYWNSFPAQSVTAESMTCTTYTDDSCASPLIPTKAPPTDLEKLQADLSARKPILEVKIPGLNFSDVVSTSDETGTYFYIAWLPEFISAVYKFGIAVISIMAVVVIILQGVRIVTSGGGEAKAAAYKRILQSVVGLFIAWGSYAILYNINPALVQFNALKVRVVVGEDLNIPVSGNDPGQEALNIEPTTLPPGRYDSLFQKYANCVGINWQILRMIARAESHFDPNLVNKAGFIGLFQTKPANCKGKFVGKYAKYAASCTVENLKNPSFNTAVGAMYQKDTLNLIDRYCKDGDLTLQLAIFYSVLNSGFGGTRSMLQYAEANGGCTESNVREGSRIFWHNASGGKHAKWFVNYYPPSYCQEFTDQLDCMGVKKFNNVFRNAKRAVSEGVTSIRLDSPGECPLDTDNPFPPS